MLHFATKTCLFFTTTSLTHQSYVINMAIEPWFLKWFLIYRKCKSIPLTALSDILTFRSNWTFYNCRSLDDFDFILATKFTIMASHWRFFTFSAYENSFFTTRPHFSQLYISRWRKFQQFSLNVLVFTTFSQWHDELNSDKI